MFTGSDVYAMMSDMILAALYASGPVLAVALILGLGIAFFQALTQIQEMTLTFVPKIVGIFLGVIASAPFMFDQVSKLSTRVFDIIASGNF
jgi:flagellar biosynthesis protein FliQ